MPRKNKKLCSAANSRARKRSQPRSCSVTTTPSSPRRLASRMSSMGLRLLSAECQLVWMCRSKIIPRFLSGSRRCRCSIHRLQRLVYSICGAVVSNKKKHRPIPPCPLTAHRVGCARLCSHAAARVYEPQVPCNVSLFSLLSKYGRKRSDQSLCCLGPGTSSARLQAPGAPRPAWPAGRPDCGTGGGARLDHVNAPRAARTGGTPAVMAGAAPYSLRGGYRGDSPGDHVPHGGLLRRTP